MLKKIAVTAGLLLAMSGSRDALAYEAQLEPFQDVGEKAWYADYVYTLNALGVIDGAGEGIFLPEETLTREAFIKMLVTTAGIKGEEGEAVLPADAAGRWSAPYLAVALKRDWIDFLVDGKGDLKPGQPITREEVASVMGRYLLDQAGTEVSSAWLQGGWNAEKTKHPFPDDSAIAPSLAPTVYYTVNQGVMEGDDGFRPRALLKRSEAAAVVNRMMDKRAGQHPLQMTGFYAIQSFHAADRMTALNQVVFGWSSLKYEGAGKGGLETRTGDYKVPDGAELAVEAADKAGLAKDLMVYAADRDKLSAFLKDAAAKESFLKELKAQLDDPRFGYTGVCIDFEDLRNGEEAPGFVRFLQELKAGLPGKSLSVAVPPGYYYKGYDLQGIGASADTVILMAYDFDHEASGLPSAPLPLVNETVQEALKAVPAGKLVLGISKQANQWLTEQGVTRLLEPAIDAVERRKTDPATVSSFALPFFLNRLHDETGGRISDIYYEDTASIAKKIWLAKYYGLKGVSLWYMGNLTESDWELVSRN